MEVVSQPVFSLPLTVQPRIHDVGAGAVGTQPVEWCVPIRPHWQICIFEGETSVEVFLGKQKWKWAVGPHTVLVLPGGSKRLYTTPRRIMHFFAAFDFPPGSNTTEGMADFAPIIPLGFEAITIERDFSAAVDLRPSYPDESDLLIWLILRRLARLTREMRGNCRHAIPVVQSVMARVRRHLADTNMTPETLASSARLSRRRLDQLFTKAVGQAVGAWIREQRLVQARRLLEETTIPIGRIGEATGLSDPHHFNKFIHRACGCSPTDIRHAASRQRRAEAGHTLHAHN